MNKTYLDKIIIQGSDITIGTRLSKEDYEDFSKNKDEIFKFLGISEETHTIYDFLKYEDKVEISGKDKNKKHVAIPTEYEEEFEKFLAANPPE